MADLVNTILHLIALIGADATLVADAGTCTGFVTRMGVATLDACPTAVLLDSDATLYLGVTRDRSDEPVVWGYAEHRQGDTWDLHFETDEPEGWQ